VVLNALGRRTRPLTCDKVWLQMLQACLFLWPGPCKGWRETCQLRWLQLTRSSGQELSYSQRTQFTYEGCWEERETTNAGEEHKKCSADSGQQLAEPGILSPTAVKGAAENLTGILTAAQAAAPVRGRQVSCCYLLPLCPASVCSSFGRHF